MGSPRMLRDDAPDDVLRDLMFTESALAADPDAADLAPAFAGQLEKWEAATKALRAALRKEVHADANVVMSDAALDEAVIRFSDDLLRALGKDANHPRFRRYFKQAPSHFVRTTRLEEATTVKSWVSSIQGEPEPEVSRHAELLAKAASASISALDAAATAAGERASLRLKEWGGYVRGVDAARDALYADLVKRGQERNKPRDWANRFFPTRGRAQKETEPPETGGAKPA